MGCLVGQIKMSAMGDVEFELSLQHEEERIVVNIALGMSRKSVVMQLGCISNIHQGIVLGYVNIEGHFKLSSIFKGKCSQLLSNEVMLSELGFRNKNGLIFLCIK